MAENEHIKQLRQDEYHIKGEKNGCVFKPCGIEGHIYRENGFEYAKRNLASWYNKNFSISPGKDKADNILGPKKFISKLRDPRSSSNIWHIGAGIYKDYNYKLGQWPFTNQHHHILPRGSLHDSLSISELKWLMKCKYNINAGLNIIILPTDETPAKLMDMLTHLGSHKTYSDDVAEIIKEIKGKFSKGKDDESDGHEPVDEENMPNVKTELENWSKSELAELFIGGYTSPASKVADAAVVGLDI